MKLDETANGNRDSAFAQEQMRKVEVLLGSERDLVRRGEDQREETSSMTKLWQREEGTTGAMCNQ